MPLYTDQLNRLIEIPAFPKRIISLVPSQTELLFDLGLEEEVIGITKFCVHPEQWFRNKTRIGGTKNVKIDLVASLLPDLIIANKEENTKEQIEALEKIAPVWVSDIETIEEAFVMMENIGEITGKKSEADALVTRIKKSLINFSSQRKKSGTKMYRTAYLIWKDPYMAAGGDTFIHHQLQLAGFENVLGNTLRYPEITLNELKTTNTELLLLSSEPYPFQQKHIDELQTALPDTRIFLVDGEIFSWYGSRMQYAASYLSNLLKQLKQQDIL
jgi:ABC-type Fe3+-hydroxamate transport system substrate-binding protein